MIFGKHQDNTIEQFKEYSATATKSALLADGHYGIVAPVGSVWAHPSKIQLNGIGPDAACGNCAVKTDVHIDDIAPPNLKYRTNTELNKLADRIAKEIKFGMGATMNGKGPSDDLLFDSEAWKLFPTNIKDSLRDTARNQIGSCGSGNHYCDVFVGTDGFLWVGNHFGSRGYGFKLAKHFMALGQGLGWDDKPKEIFTTLDMNTQLGQDYWQLLQLAGAYAYAGRNWVADTVANMFGGNVVDRVHNHHNFTWLETHDGQDLYVTRKGATPAGPNLRGFVGGSMGDNAVILEGANLSDSYLLDEINTGAHGAQKASLYSTVHGSGRVMSRTEAMGKIDRKTGKLKINKETGEISKAGKITQAEVDAWMTKADVILRGSGIDEAPQVYRRLPDVLREQGPTINVLETLKPIIVVMAGANDADHYHIEG
jgi:tRNA-splicing ligase RtcB